MIAPDNRPSLAIISLGCDKNRSDTESLMGQIQDIVRFDTEDAAEYVFVNSCGFLEEARQELFDILSGLKGKKVLLAGCFQKMVTPEFLDQYPHIVHVVNFSEYDSFRELFARLTGQKEIPNKPQIDLIKTTPSSYRYLKISEGCNNTCSFCIIPQLKGKMESRHKLDILKTAMNIVAQGVHELILVAQDTADYGADRGDRGQFLSLLQDLLRIDTLKKIRLHYLYPERISDELLELFVTHSDKLVPYFDMPIQHANDTILRRMNRPYTRKELETLIAKIRQTVPNAVIRSTVIVGFPTETEEQFQDLIDFLRTQSLEHIGAFIYSDEPTCAAYQLTGKVDPQTAQDRYERLMQVQQEISEKHLARFVGTKQTVVIDSYDEENELYIGRNYYFAPDVDGVIYIDAEDKELKVGQTYTVKITENTEYDLIAVIQ